MASPVGMPVLQLDPSVRRSVEEARSEYANVGRPISAPPVVNDMTSYTVVPSQSVQDGVHRSNVIFALDEVTRVYEVSMEEYEHIEFMLTHKVIDVDGAMALAQKVGRPRPLITSPGPARVPTMITTSQGSQAPEAPARAPPVSWTESQALRTADAVKTVSQGTTTEGLLPKPSAPIMPLEPWQSPAARPAAHYMLSPDSAQPCGGIAASRMVAEPGQSTGSSRVAEAIEEVSTSVTKD